MGVSSADLRLFIITLIKKQNMFKRLFVRTYTVPAPATPVTRS